MEKLFNSTRLSKIDEESQGSAAAAASLRSEFERDFDRILFSAPVRRLADKTQVFPLEKNDSVRTRLTHSHEVSNLCRSLANQLCREVPGFFGTKGEDAVVIAAAVGLAHDLGNPPFGHQGEEAIRRWFNSSKSKLLPEGIGLSEAQEKDFEKWEGNAQAFRLLSRLQLTKGEHGLDLTAATLSALMKYTVASTDVEKGAHPSKKKFGYFQDDLEAAHKVLQLTGVEPGQRHPIAYLMEACDDIAYSVIDIEDSIKKKIISINDVIDCIQRTGEASSHLSDEIKSQISSLHDLGRSPSEVDDIAAQYYRSFVVDFMVRSVVETAKENSVAIADGSFGSDLISASAAGKLCKALKDLAFAHAYSSPSVKEVELRGDLLLHRLADFFWRGVRECSLAADDHHALAEQLKSPPPTPFGEFVFSHISSNYRRCFADKLEPGADPAEVCYRQLLLVTDMLSGMTENFALDLCAKFERLDDAKPA